MLYIIICSKTISLFSCPPFLETQYTHDVCICAHIDIKGIFHNINYTIL